ncbi:hypothetical protein OBBRIDRAFT_886411 [Obba rivulosa]|uniref:Mitogen-activated protein kinase kinase kinase 1 n=1 Tax=Obba rivulosa TaxID=1052685 RepID=A0A8E2DMK0_9APHY|nr:hypothetical protein OBBRIDRAFT_886411 [Obba rivulosa]
MGKRRPVDEPYSNWTPTAPPPELYYGSSYASTSGSASNPIILDSPPKAPPAKRARKKKDPDTPQSEKRGAITRKKCPKNILERLDRVISQRFFLVDRRREGHALREEFSVLGSTGNVYTVVVDKKPSCNCPDALKGNHCKHILFIFLKVLQVTQESGYWYQKALLTSELEDIFANAPPAPNSILNTRVREAYARATGKPVASSSATDVTQKKRIPGAEDDCPICYENLHGAKESELTFCQECGNAVHKECFQQWARKSAANLTCVFCRAKWVVAPAIGNGGSSGAVRSSEGYVNLAGVAGLSPVRDTSSYYHGPRRGQRHYGYQDYF